MYRLKYTLSLVLPLPMVMADSKSDKDKKTQNLSKLKKPSELPLYEGPEDLYSYEYHGKETPKLEEGVAIVRQELQTALEMTKETRKSINLFYETGKAHSMATVDYIMDDENLGAKVGVITVGGLAGLLVGARRGGFFKKLFYTSLGAGGTASLCYPKYASQYSKELVENAGDYAVIGYNFIVGVKPQAKESNDLPEAKKGPSTITLAPAALDQTPSTPEVSTTPHRTFEALAEQASDITYWGFRLKKYKVSDTVVESNPLGQPFDPGDHQDSSTPLESVTQKGVVNLQTDSEGQLNRTDNLNLQGKHLSTPTSSVEKISKMNTEGTQLEVAVSSVYELEIEEADDTNVESIEYNDQKDVIVSKVNVDDDEDLEVIEEEEQNDVEREKQKEDAESNIVEANLVPGVIFKKLVLDDSSFDERWNKDRSLIGKMKKDYEEEKMLKELFFSPKKEIVNQTAIQREEVIKKPTTKEDILESKSVYAKVRELLFGNQSSVNVDQDKSIGNTSTLSKVEEIIEDVMEEAVSIGANAIAEEVKEDAKKVSETAEKVEAISEKVEKISEFVEIAAENASKAAHGISPSLETKTKRLEEVAKVIEEVSSAVEIASEKTKEVSETIAEIAENVEVELKAFTDAKQNEIMTDIEEYIGDEGKFINDREDSTAKGTESKKPKESFYGKIIDFFNPDFKNKSFEKREITLEAQEFKAHDSLIGTSDENLSMTSEDRSSLDGISGTLMEDKPTIAVKENLNIPIDENESNVSQTSKRPKSDPSETIKIMPESSLERLEKIEQFEDLFINAMLKSQVTDNVIEGKSTFIAVKSGNEMVIAEQTNKTELKIGRKISESENVKEVFAGPLAKASVKDSSRQIPTEDLSIKALFVDPPMKPSVAEDPSNNTAGTDSSKVVSVEDPATKIAVKVPSKKVFIEDPSKKSVTYPPTKVSVKNPSNKVSSLKDQTERITDLDRANTNVISANVNSDSNITIKIMEDLRFIEAPGQTIIMPDDVPFEKDPSNMEPFNQRNEPQNNRTETSPPTKNQNPKDIIVKLESSPAKAVVGDIGQSNPEDKDMYTTRS